MNRRLAWAALAAVGIAAALAAQIRLQALFATAEHPTTLLRSNHNADAALARDWHRTLLDQGTLDRMVTTERFDYLWMLALAAALVSITMLASALLERRAPRASRRLRRLAPAAALPAAVDAAENAVSLAMLADPLGFPELLAPLHASLAWLKLACVVAVAVGASAYTLVAAVKGERHGDHDAVPPRLAAQGPP
ncbi:hypothetical protein [Glycomyces tenuis]|uniref:hypothetical protein n=1 Tax=Glycomyces tenuis TaxID=58116 RepID=UPI0004244C7D|nr:hypothetical protein [Glycomyces tenuis]